MLAPPPQRRGRTVSAAGIGDAVAFLTRLPLPWRSSSGRLDQAALFFPLVGLLVGGTGALVRLGAGYALPRTPATILAVGAMILLTGGLHEDGLADAADALAPHVSAARRLEIMRDPRIGSYGVLALVLAVVLAVALLSPLSSGHFARTVLVAHLLARWSMLPLALWGRRARSDGLGSTLRPGVLPVAGATGYSVAIAVWLAGPVGAAEALAGAVVLIGLGALWANRMLGGVTGDVFGATGKLVELAAYATLA